MAITSGSGRQQPGRSRGQSLGQPRRGSPGGGGTRCSSPPDYLECTRRAPQCRDCGGCPWAPLSRARVQLQGPAPERPPAQAAVLEGARGVGVRGRSRARRWGFCNHLCAPGEALALDLFVCDTQGLGPSPTQTGLSVVLEMPQEQPGWLLVPEVWKGPGNHTF